MNEPVIFNAGCWVLFENSTEYLSNPDSFFASNGDGVLTDCVSCLVTEEKNGIFDLELTYPADGVHADIIDYKAIIKAKARPSTRIIDPDDPYWTVDLGKPQLFYVYEIVSPMSGLMTVRAHHISYVMSGIPCRGWDTGNDLLFASDALRRLDYHNGYVIGVHPFRFLARGNSSKRMSVAPSSIKNKLLGLEGSILDTYGGEFLFDNFKVILYNGNQSRGFDNGVTIEYGKNLQSLEQDRNCAELYNGIYPFYYGYVFDTSTTKTLVELTIAEAGSSAPIIEFDDVGGSDIHNYLSVDLTDAVSQNVNVDGQTQAQAEATIRVQLAVEANSYIASNSLKTPNVSLTVSFAQLQQFEEYKDTPFLDTVALCDTIRVIFPKLGIDVKTQIVKVVYNPLLDRVESVDIGTPRKTIVSKR